MKAARNQIEAEEVADNQFLGPLNTHRKFVQVLCKFLLNIGRGRVDNSAGVAEELLEAVKGDNEELTHRNQAYLLGALALKIERHEGDLLRQGEHLERLEQNVSESLIYVGPNTSEAKLGQLASIAVSGAMVFTGDAIDQTREFLRMVDLLHASDVAALQELDEVQTGAIEGLNTEQRLGAIQSTWETVVSRLIAYGLKRSHINSAFVRLQSHGLVERADPAHVPDFRAEIKRATRCSAS